MTGLAHTQRIQRLYRRALMTSRDWVVNTSLWRAESLRIRQLFDNNRHVTSPQQVEHLIANAERALTKYQHPEPYKVPTGIDGSKWERNLPPRKEAVQRGFGDFI